MSTRCNPRLQLKAPGRRCEQKVVYQVPSRMIHFPKQDNSSIFISAFQHSDQKSLQVPNLNKMITSSHVFTPKRFASTDNFHYLFFSQTTKIQLIFKNFKNRPISKTNQEMRHFPPIFAHFRRFSPTFFAP